MSDEIEKIVPTPILTQEEVDAFLEEEKEILAKPSSSKKSNQNHSEIQMKAKGLKSSTEFIIFVRQNLTLTENFSVGLRIRLKSGESIVIARYNGDHGQHKNKLTNEIINGPHKHFYKQENAEKGIKAEDYAISATEYVSLQQALTIFCNELRVINYLTYMPELDQIQLFEV